MRKKLVYFCVKMTVAIKAERRRVEAVVRRLLQRGKLSVEEIAEDVAADVQLVLEVQAEMGGAR